MEPILQTLAPRLEAWIEQTRPELISDLSELARIPSVAAAAEGPYPCGKACGQVLDSAAEILQRRGFASKNHEYHCLTLELPGRTERRIGLFCHLDGVAAGTGWQTDPYVPVVKDGHIFARGVTDNKGPAVAMLSLLRFLRQENVGLEHTVMLFLGACEERGMEDIDWYLTQFAPPEMSLTPDAQFSVCCGEKGHLVGTLTAPLPQSILSFTGGTSSNAVPDTASIILRDVCASRLQEALDASCRVERTAEGVCVSVSGLPAHAAFPESGINAIVKLCRALLASGCVDQEAERFLAAYVKLFSDCHGEGLGVSCSDEPSGRLTAVGGKLRTTAGRVKQSLDIRYPVTADAGGLVERLKSTTTREGFAVVNLENSAPLYYSPDHPLIHMLNDTCNEVLGTDLKPYVIGGGTYARKLPMAVAFGHLLRSRPRPGGSGKGGGHQVDECVSIQGLEDLMRIYLRALIRMDQLSVGDLNMD